MCMLLSGASCDLESAAGLGCRRGILAVPQRKPFRSRPTKAHHRSDSNRHECLEANYALSSLNAEDVGG